MIFRILSEFMRIPRDSYRLLLTFQIFSKPENPESETETQLSTQKMSEKVAFVYPLIYRHCKYLCRRSTLAALYSFKLQISRLADNFLNVLRTMDLQTVQFYSHFKYTAAAPQNIQFLCGSWPHQEYTSFTR